MIEPTYPLPAVLAVIGITEATATNWSKRGYQAADIPPAGRGRARRVSFDDVVRLAVMAEIVAIGLSPTQSGFVAGCVKFPVTAENQVLVIPRFGVVQVTSWRAIEEEPHLSIRVILHASNAYQGLKEPYDDPDTKLQPASVIILDVLVIEERVKRALKRIPLPENPT